MAAGAAGAQKAEGVRLYAGGDATTVQKRPVHLTGFRCFTAAHRARTRFPAALVPHVRGLLDSGAFSDPPEKRRTPAGALDRQLSWEAHVSRVWGAPWRADALVSYDLLIDEHWANGQRTKRRWGVAEAESAVAVTVEAAAYLSSQRARLAPRALVLACQGVDARQYEECAAAVLRHAAPGDWLGLGGWCILGWWRTWIPVFWDAARRVLPMAKAAGLGHAHLFGVLYPPVLGGLLWLCDGEGLTLSTDSAGPVLSACRVNPRRAGTLMPTWEANSRLWRERLRRLRTSRHYREPPGGAWRRQRTLFA